MARRFHSGKLLTPILGGVLACVGITQTSHAAWWQLWRPTSSQPASPAKGAHVKVRFEGHGAFTERQLRVAIDEQLGRIRSEGLSRPNADDAAYYTAVFYHQCGYHSAEVAWKITDDTLLLTVTEGRLVQLLSSSIEGNLSLPAPRLLSLLTSVTTDRLRLPENQIPFVSDEIQMGANRILDLYLSEGFLEAEVDAPEVKFSEDGAAASVQITVREGGQYQFGRLKFLGQTLYPEADILKTVQPILAKPYTLPRQVALQNALQKFYESRGHFEAEVQVSEQPASPERHVSLAITIRPGPVYYFQGVETEGLVRLREKWLRHRLLSLEGRLYNPDLLNRKQLDLLSSGLFESLKITPVPQKDHTLRLQVDVQEPMYRELGLSVGYGSYEGAMGGVRYANRNLFGHGILGSVEVNMSQRALGLETTLSDPWLFETRTEFVTRAFIRGRVEIGYEKRDAGIRGELSRRLYEPLKAALFTQMRSVEITRAAIPAEELGSTAYQVVTLGSSLTWDKRDSVLNPSTGWIASLLAETNTLSDGSTYTRTSGRLGWHYPLPARIRFGISARAGLLSQQSSTPIDERYFLGGSTTVRSFSERELGVHDSKSYPIGGSAYSLLNAETDFPVWQRLRGALFYDTGSLSPKGGQIPTSNFRSAVGVGLRYTLPFGPVRFDVGVNPDRRSNEHWGAAHLSFGFAF